MHRGECPMTPLDMAIALMKSGNVRMHGPEHLFVAPGLETGAFSGAVACEFFHPN